MQGRRKMGFPGWWLGAVALFFILVPVWSQQETPSPSSWKSFVGRTDVQAERNPSPLQLRIQRDQVVMDNGIVQVTLTVPEGFVVGIKYNGIDNLLETRNEEDDRGYWDINWNKPESGSIGSKIKGTKFNVIRNDGQQIELSFVTTWSASSSDKQFPLNIDKRFILLPGKSGFYSYGIYERLRGWPALEVDQTRIVFKLQKYKFRYMAISDTRQRIMPLLQDREAGQPLAYPEAVRLTNASDSGLKGEVDDKYQYSSDNEDSRVHGWISFYPSVGFWMITPSNEFRAGPLKQELTSHVGPFTLSMFVSLHYAGKPAGLQFRQGEPWKKVFGPVFVYLNSVPFEKNPISLWQDAKAQMLKETENWPYNFPLSKDFPYSADRGNVIGQLLVCDRYINVDCLPAAPAQVGLALPGPPGAWQTENKGYQFWIDTDKQGRFFIKGVRSGEYSLYAWVRGIIGDYTHNVNVVVTPGSNINLGVLKYMPPRYGPTLWEIGYPDRTAAEFFVPNPAPNFVNHLYIKRDRFRQYGLWQRYADLYPDRDLIFTVGVSDYRKDWFFAHVNRRVGNNEYKPTVWQIIFDLKNPSSSQTYVLQLALASATASELQVRINNPVSRFPLFTTGLIGRDNAIARHGIYGIYALYSVNIPGSELVNGRNTIFLWQSRATTPFQGIMYDYIRLEGPPSN
ncbi:rhamnogalacturonate lyase B-like [Malania oleifera]|uniref:rhamnogalacturonate lyase B-like n=1 Tax=Malania oleifera TaxID=397392 RepID=UPI0025AE7F61|nr:rhamnogalacturonate lyase B-like [Malania oleifera]XP_057969024.1 rhamnogalacturonate lyase B-like [Malania oleifera]